MNASKTRALALMCLLVAGLFIVNICQPVSGAQTSGDAEGAWAPGMYWTFEYTEGTATEEVNMTVLGTQVLTNLTGVQINTYKIKEDHSSDPEGRYYSWYDVDNLDVIAKYQSNDDGIMAVNSSWTYDGEPRPYEVGSSMFVGYKRVSDISAMPMPVTRSYPSTFEVAGMEWVTVPAGTFYCYNITITDNGNGNVNWNYYYNDTVKHWVKFIDNRPTAMGVSQATYDLTSYGAAEEPVFITESGERNIRSYDIEWADYADTVEYVLYENGEEVYRGTATSYAAGSMEDGSYEYVVEAVLPDGLRISSGTLTIVVDYVVPVPGFTTEAGTVDGGELTIEWTAVDGADRYVLLVESEDEWEEAYNGTETSFTFTDLSDGTYRYRVQAWDGDKSSQLSSSLVMTVEGTGKSITGEEAGVLVLSMAIGIVVIVGLVFLLKRRS